MSKHDGNGTVPHQINITSDGYFGTLARLVFGTADSLSYTVSTEGWHKKTIASANALTTTIFDAWGPGDYSIHKGDAWHERPVNQHIPWMAHVPASRSRRP